MIIFVPRFGYSNPVNYNDNELYCGGFSVQWSNNDGKCGVCGDNWADPAPRFRVKTKMLL